MKITENVLKILFNEKAKKIIEIVFWIAILFFISELILIKPLNDLDEMWNYNFSKNILEGRLPYKDFNTIITPLVPYIGAVFLKLFGNEMFSMRIFAIITNFLILFFSYMILIKLKVNESLSKILIMAFVHMLKSNLRIDYNFFTLLLVLSIIWLEIENIKKENKKIDLLLGIIAGLCICCKHTVGICIAIVVIFYQIMFVKDKKTFDEFLKNLLCRFIGLAAVLALLCMYFAIFKLWEDFISYAIFGIKDFSNRISYMKLINSQKWHISFLSIIVLIYLIINLIIVIINKLRKKELEKNNIIILAYSWAAMALVFPISDEVHFLAGCILTIIGIIYIINKMFLNEETKWNYIEIVEYVLTVYIVIVAILNLFDVCKAFEKMKNENQINHFKLIPESLYSRVKTVDEYIKSQEDDVYILDANAVLYMIPIDQYNKNYDMFNKGNLGSKGEEGVIEELEKKENVQILILQDTYIKNWQTPLKVINFVKGNYNKVGSIGIFDIYYNK